MFIRLFHISYYNSYDLSSLFSEWQELCFVHCRQIWQKLRYRQPLLWVIVLMLVKLAPKIMAIVSHIHVIQIFINLFLDPDPLEQAMGREKKMMIARLAGDDVCWFCLFYNIPLLNFSVTNQKSFTVQTNQPAKDQTWCQLIFLNVLLDVSVNRMLDTLTSWLFAKVIQSVANADIGLRQ